MLKEGRWFPRKRTKLAITGLLASVVLHINSSADTITLSPVADTSLHEVAPTNNMGGHTHVAAGSTAHAASRSRGLFRFDLQGSVPSNAVINSVSVILQVTGTPFGGGANSTFGLHRLLRSWGEGTKVGNLGSTASDGEATWIARFWPSDLWAISGGESATEYIAQESSSVFVAGTNSYTFDSTPNLVADVQAWVTNAATNFGWMLISQSEEVAQTARRFGSRESGATAPALTVEFTLPPTPSPPRIDRIEAKGADLSMTFRVEAGFNYAVEFTGALPATNWLVLTNVGAKVMSFDATITDPLTASQRFYRLSRVPCNCR